MATMMEPNPVTGVKEPYFPEKTRTSRMLTGSVLIVMMVSSSRRRSDLPIWPVCTEKTYTTASKNEIQIKRKMQEAFICT